MAADEPDVTYDFTGSDWTVSNGVLSNGTVSFSGQGGNSFKMNSGYFIMGKSSAYINFPTYSSPVSKIVVTGRSGASADVKQNIFVGETAVSTETKGATGANTYEIASGQQAAGTQYTLKVTSNHNTQITKIEVYFGSSSDPSISANDAAVSWDAEGGNIEYTISNPVEGGFVMATEWDTEATWLQFSGNGSGNKLPFTVSTNYGGERSANVTLKYTYVIDQKAYDASTTVTVTQGAKPAPVIIVDQDSYTIGKDQTSIEIPYTIQYPNPNTNPALAFEGNTEWTTLGRVFDYDNNKVTITTDANNTPERTVNVVFKYDGAADKTVTLTQEGVIWPTVSFRANPAEGADGFLCINTSDNSKQLTSGDMVKPGDWIAISVTPAGNNYEFANWTEANNKLEIANPTETTISFQMPEEDVEIVANFNAPSIEWVKTSISDLTANDVFVIVGNNADNYAMSNDQGTGSAPTAVGGVTISGDKITSAVADNIQWNISSDTNGYTFYPKGSTTTWLYCTNSNNGVRVGTNTDKVFTIKEGYLYNTATSRYVGIYNSQDWRCYTSINANIKDQTFAFYKKVSTAPDERAEAGLAFNESSYSVELVNAASFTSPVLSNPNELSPITWTSSNETVATVNEGTVTILSEGETTIKAKFEGNDDYKPGEASYTLTVQDSRLEPTVTIDATGITNTNRYTGTTAGSLAATVTYNEATIDGATVTWSGNNDEVATINEETGVVTLVAAGTVTFTATYAGNSDYAEKTATYVMTVTNVDPNAPGSENNPYTVAEAIAATPTSGTTDNVYIKGIVSQFYNTSIVGDGTNYRYYISDNGTTTNQLLVYKGKGLNNTAFSSADDLQIGDVVTILGGLTTYNNAPEVASGNYIVSLIRKPAAPTFDPAAGTYTSTQYVTISAADGAAIYYTTDGTSPTTESNLYSEPIEVNTDMTIKAIAVKDSEVSDVATAEYVINLTPSIVFDGEQNPANVTYTAGETNIHYVASNVADLPTIVICDNEGNQASYDWFSAEVTSDVYVHVTWQANTDTENSRTAYFKLISGATESEIFEFTQAKYVPDYAELPFEFNDGRADIEETDGLTQEGLGDDYKASTNPTTKLKFDTTGDWMILKINEIPGTLTFDIKGNSFSGGTFKVQTSADGVTFTDLASYTSIGSDTETKEFDDLADNVRYIKWVYTEKVSGNVGLGNINLAKPITDPVIKLAETSVEVDAKQHDGTIALTYKNLQIDDMDDFDVQFYSDEQGTVTADAPEWVEALVAEQDPNVGPGYVLSYVINANDGAERTAYLRVYADDGVNSVASDVVTITQKAPQTTYRKVTSTVGITSGKYLIVYEEESKVFNGSLGTLDAANNCQEVVINDNEIKTNEAIYFNIDVNAGTLQSASGKYIGVDSNSNGLSQSEESKTYTNSFSIDGDGNAVIAAVFTGSTMTLRFNSNSNQNRFRYFKNNQKAIQLYKEVTDEEKMAIPIAAACTDGQKCYSTFSSTKPFVVSEDLTVSEIGINTDGTMNVVNYDAGAVVPANTGVMVSAQEGKTYAVSVATAEEAASATSVLGVNNRLRPTGDNGLTATEMTSAEPETCKFYRLTMHNGTTIGFWWGADGGDSFAIVANKAYLAVPTSVAGARNGFAFGDDATGINNVNINLNDNCYDLQGRKVSTPGKGLYIVNGKKVVIK